MNQKKSLRALVVGSLFFGAAACAGAVQSADADRTATSETQLGGYFGWPFLPAEAMKPRGGTTQGAPVVMAKESNAGFKRWKRSEQGSAKERDRAAIVAMAGTYRVSFQFVELAGFVDNYTPPRPYFSWGTEHVQVLEEREDFVSLQHTLVMYTNDNGQMTGPLVMKHWRQDWTFEDPLVVDFVPPRSWSPRKLPPTSGTWTQAVYQVDDSPRYELVGRWQHLSGGPQFESRPVDRPLPRREFSVRDDYNVLESTFRITVTPGGWVHETFSRKIDTNEGVRMALSTETGINRYENIASPKLDAPAMAYWSKTGPYWASVRNQWKGLIEAGKPFTLRAKVDDKKLWEHHFQMAGHLESGDVLLEEALLHAEKTVRSFVVKSADVAKEDSFTRY